MDDVKMGNGVDDVYEMDCPKFVDFTVPQDMNDNADEWFNFDHENGIPLAFDEEGATEDAPATEQHPQGLAEEAHSEDDSTEPQSLEPEVAVPKEQNLSTSQREDLSSSDPETLPSPQNTVCQVSANTATAEESPEPEMSESEEMKMSSLSEDTCTSSVEMSTDSLEAENVSEGQDTGDSTDNKPKTQGSPEIPVPKRRGNIVTSFSQRDDDSSTIVHNQKSRPKQKRRSQRQSIEVAPRSMLKSSRLLTRRSADSTRLKRNSTSQATKRRSANPSFSRPGSSSVDQPNNKRRKMVNDESVVVGQSDAKKSCPKMKGKMCLTIPTTPTLLKRNMAKPSTQIKSTEELEMDRIAHFKKGLIAIRKKSAQSFKVVKGSAPVVPAHATIQPTKPDEFKFETDARLKSHPMETRKDARNNDFIGNLRKYIPSPSKHHGPTRLKPFNFSDSRKRTHEESFSAEKGYEFRSTALAVSQFQTKTPERFRSRPTSEQNKGPEPAIDRPKKSKLTHPLTPALESRNRHRPVTAISQAQREEQQLVEMKNYKFKARPVDPRVMSNVSVGVKTANHKEPTRPIGFDLEIEKRLLERDAKRITHHEEPYEFRAKPLPARILAGPVGIAEAKHVPVTLPKSPAFALKNRVKVYEEKEREKETEPEHGNPHIIKARPIMHVGVPFMPSIQHKRTEPAPFSFDEKIQESKARKEAKKLEILKEEEKVRQFRAQPLPDPSCSGIPDKMVRPPTQSAPFNVAERGAKQAEEWSKKMEGEIKECKRIANAFKAKPANILYEEPFVPEKSVKAMTDISNFILNTERRAEERKEYEQNKYERQCVVDAALAQREVEREEEMRREISKQRAEAVHRANPVRQYKTVEVLPSTKPLTQPMTPKFSDRTRKNSLV